MKALVIGASTEAVHAIQIAKRQGYEVIALDGDPEAGGLQAADRAFCVDIRSPQAVYLLLEKEGIRPDVILPVPIGRFLTTTGEANDHYGLYGVSEEGARNSTDKWQFHQKMRKEGLRSISAWLFLKGMQIEETNLPAISSYPVVVKPRYGSGSRGVRVCENAHTLLRDLSEEGALREDQIVEQMVEGVEYGVDGAFENGHFHLILLRKKMQTPLPYRQCVGYLSVPPESDLKFYRRVEAFLQQTGKALGFVNCLIHADLIRQQDDTPFLIETSARPSGHHLHDLFTPMVTGLDPVASFLELAFSTKTEEPYCVHRTKRMMIRYFDLPEGRLEKVPQEEELERDFPLRDVVCHLKKGDEIREVTDGASLMVRGYYILEADSEEELHRLSAEIRSRFSSSV